MDFQLLYEFSGGELAFPSLLRRLAQLLQALDGLVQCRQGFVQISLRVVLWFRMLTKGKRKAC